MQIQHNRNIMTLSFRSVHFNILKLKKKQMFFHSHWTESEKKKTIAVSAGAVKRLINKYLKKMRFHMNRNEKQTL